MSGLVYMQIANTQNQPENQPGPETLKLFFMPSSTEHEIFPAQKCPNANNCWHFNIYEWEK